MHFKIMILSKLLKWLGFLTEDFQCCKAMDDLEESFCLLHHAIFVRFMCTLGKKEQQKIVSPLIENDSH